MGLATRCDEIGQVAVILGFWKHRKASQSIAKHRKASQTIAGISSKITAVWPVSYSQWNVFMISCDGHHCDGN